MDIAGLREKAQRGDVVACTILGIYLLEGTGVEKDVAAAFQFLSVAAQEGVPRARLYLGRMYLHGIGCAPDLSRALHLLERSAQGGELLGAIELARYWKNTDPLKAYGYYQRALDLNIPSCPETEEAKEYVTQHWDEASSRVQTDTIHPRALS